MEDNDEGRKNTEREKKGEEKHERKMPLTTGLINNLLCLARTLSGMFC